MFTSGLEFFLGREGAGILCRQLHGTYCQDAFLGLSIWRPPHQISHCTTDFVTLDVPMQIEAAVDEILDFDDSESSVDNHD